MLVQGEFSLDSRQMYSDSFKEALRQTMLSQEVMFRKQVLAAHFILCRHFYIQELVPFWIHDLQWGFYLTVTCCATYSSPHIAPGSSITSIVQCTKDTNAEFWLWRVWSMQF